MREIKFRGKRINSGTMVFGDLLNGIGAKYNKKYIYPNVVLLPKDCHIMDGYEVEPETIGQYTGLRDKNGKEIYEGDIVKINGADRIYYIRWFDDMCFGFADIRSDYLNTFYECYNTHNNGFPCDTHIEVIGNIYENPELIK